ncbi:stage V sporulation protein T [Paenalkalicoccus suaedae]|uniref:Stage V sporulation protein T n=1 Tax=Paenalkalicoccus suaedae TaxID=2592382 RepID=A0A859FAV3_9BACI|nr:stage V sporulation protein T [Paenalkalicoccus suaedae]QKS69644.1 stage V sporulation protein T [Paenalkalicoccus suaedae]
MKATGIVRRIDDLGRVVIPKEIRRTLRIREGDPLEIFVDREGEVILKKYSPISELNDFSKEYAEALYDSLHQTILIADRDTFINVAGGAKKDYQNRPIGKLIEEAIEQRAAKIEKKPGSYIIAGEIMQDLNGYCISPIIANGDPIGAVIILAKDTGEITNVEIKLAETAASFLARQMEH